MEFSIFIDVVTTKTGQRPRLSIKTRLKGQREPTIFAIDIHYTEGNSGG